MSEDQTSISELPDTAVSGALSAEDAIQKPRRRRRTESETALAPVPEVEPSAIVEKSVESVSEALRTSEARTSEAVEAPNQEQSQSQQSAAPRRRRSRSHKSDTASSGSSQSSNQSSQESREANSQESSTQQGEQSANQASSQSLTSQTQQNLREQAPADSTRERQHTDAQERRSGQQNQQQNQGTSQLGQGGNQQQSQQGQGSQQSRSRNNGRQNRQRNRRQQSEAASEPSLSRDQLQEMRVAELRSRAAALDIEYVGVRKADLVEDIYVASARAEGFRSVEGILEIGTEGYGWVRTGNYMEGDDDAFVHQQLIRSLGLRPGDKIVGTVGPGRSNSKYPPLKSIESVNDRDPVNLKDRPRFSDLTPIYPDERLVMENGRDSITGRAIDLVSPIGKGQRGLIVSPPKAGKTTVLKRICQSIAANNPEVHLFCLLVDERPEEVTDMQRSIKGEVVASTFDMPAENHTHVSELLIERAKRLVELGEDVVVVLDSITRLARAYNLAMPASGRILSGGVDSAALYPPKKFLGAARNIENGGSLTIIASALVDTGSKMDEVIFEEFKGTGNMELKLDRDLADKRIFPAIDPVASGTRNEDLLIPSDYQPLVWGLRRVLANMNNTERAATALIKGLKQTNSNEEFLIRSAKKAQQTDYVA